MVLTSVIIDLQTRSLATKDKRHDYLNANKAVNDISNLQSVFIVSVRNG